MRLARLGVVLAASCTLGRAELVATEAAFDGEVLKREMGGRLTEWRDSLLTEIRFDPAAPAAALDKPEADQKNSADPGVYRLPPYVVRSHSPNYRRLEYEIESAAAAAHEEEKATTVGRKLGIGVHTVKFRHFEMGVLTLFFIPVSVGFSW